MGMIPFLALLAALQDPAAAEADAAVARFKAAFKTPDVKARAEAVAELGKLQHAKVGRILAGLLAADEAPVRQKAAEALGRWTSKPAEVGAILQAALKPNVKEPAVLVSLLDAIGAVRDRNAAEEVNNRLNHLHNDVSVAAIRASGKLGSASSMDRLLALWSAIESYRNPTPSLSGGSGPRRTPEKDQRYGMQEPEVKAAIGAITKKTFGNLVEARAWWNANRQTFREP